MCDANVVPEKAFQKCMTWGGRTQGASPNTKSVAFWGYFSTFPFSAPPPSLPTFFPYLTALLFYPVTPSPQRGEQEI